MNAVDDLDSISFGSMKFLAILTKVVSPAVSVGDEAPKESLCIRESRR